MRDRTFGWLPIRIDASGSSWSVRTLPDFDAAVDIVQRSSRVDKEWYWPDIIDMPPERPATAYSLPTTHEITIAFGGSQDEEERLGEFLIAVHGFLYGILMTPEGWAQFNRVSIDPRRWQDFYVTASARARILDEASSKWIGNRDIREDLFGILWWHTYGLAYEHAFERFIAQYQVLDACWSLHERLTGAKRLPHGARVGELARYYDLICPTEWTLTQENDVLASIRNKIIHEAKWGDTAIGFGHPARPNESIHLELYWFNSRLILALLGEDSQYVHSKIVFQPYLIK